MSIPSLQLSERLATHVSATRFADLSATTVAATHRALLDGIGVMLAASGTSDDVKPFVALARSMGGPTHASILGSWERVSTPAAAFANGAMAHALDYEDAFDAAPVHPNASLIPAALATAQALNVSGERLITAIAIGCDLACRLALSVGDALEKAWYPPPILGAYGAVAAVAHLHELSAEQTLDAFSLMQCQVTCPQEIKFSEHTVIRAIREAFPAQAAVLSASLAREGVRGFAAPFEGRGAFFHAFANDRWTAEPLVGDLGRRFYIDELSFKPWPCCRGTHPYIEAAQRLRASHRIEPNAIQSIRASIGSVQRMLCEPLSRKRAPSTAIDAKFSIPFTVGAALTRDEITLDTFIPSQLTSADVLAVAQRVEPVFEERSPTSGRLEIELHDGARHVCDIDEALGNPKRPMNDVQLRAKFVNCAQRAAQPMSREAATALCARILSLSSAANVNTALELP